MTNAITGIDHAVFVVRDLDASEARFRKLGFALTPRGRHTTMGTANHCAMFGARDYLELLAVVEPNAHNDMFRTRLVRREGLMAVGWQTEDARAVAQAWTEAGLEPVEPVEFSRPVETPGGRKDAKFCVAQLPPDRLPGIMGFVCQQFTPEVVWLPGTLDHPNGAQGIVSLTGVAAAPEELAAIYGRAVGSERVKTGKGLLTVAAGTPIRFVTPARFAELFGGLSADAQAAPALAAISLAVASVEAAARLLDANGVPHVTTAGGIAVAPEHASGSVIEFVRA